LNLNGDDSGGVNDSGGLELSIFVHVSFLSGRLNTSSNSE